MTPDEQRAADLRAALRALSDGELVKKLRVYAHLRDDFTTTGRPRLGRLYDVLSAICADEQRRRRAEVKELDILYRHGEEPSTWWAG